MLSMIMILRTSLDGTVEPHICSCFEDGRFAPDGCCILMGLATCIFGSLLLMR
jgi:hypothetical protein